ncbi:hypothetical protein C1H46_045048 [Malus baccata]|uniref:Uncharacterized protein n=1 Tax=Malus baccata TaxID=106549 RepID=A0A540K5D5_MALBA|nr:hypothetical protein C1H46_045048 [Malus baccata]
MRVVSFAAVLLFQPLSHKFISSFGSSLLRGNVDIREMRTETEKSSSRNETPNRHCQPLGGGGKANYHLLPQIAVCF